MTLSGTGNLPADIIPPYTTSFRINEWNTIKICLWNLDNVGKWTALVFRPVSEPFRITEIYNLFQMLEARCRGRVPFTRNFCKWWLVSFVLPSGMKLGAVHSRFAHSPRNRPSVVRPVHRLSLLAITKIFLICVAGYLPREQTASVGGDIRHRTASGRQPGIAGAQHIAAAGETAQLACTAQ